MLNTFQEKFLQTKRDLSQRLHGQQFPEVKVNWPHCLPPS